MGINITIASCLAAAVIDINIYVMSNNEAIKSFTVEKNDQIKSY